MYIESFSFSKKWWKVPVDWEKIEYKGRIKFKDWENEFLFDINDIQTRAITLCVTSIIQENAESFTNKIRSLLS